MVARRRRNTHLPKQAASKTDENGRRVGQQDGNPLDRKGRDDADPRGFFGSGNKTEDAALSKSLRDSIESSFGSFVPDSNTLLGDARSGGAGEDGGDERGPRGPGNAKGRASTSPQREVYSIFAEPLQSENVAKMFEVYGNVENIELLGNKVARIRYEDVDAAHSAMTGVNDLAGVITVSASPPRSL